MYLNLLHVDEALKMQPQFIDACRALQVRETEAMDEARLIRLWGKSGKIDQLRQHLRPAMYGNGGDETMVTFMGSGDFHHVSALLIEQLAERSEEKLTVIHFDNHPDWVHFGKGLHCGSWVNHALSLPQVSHVITIGVCSGDLRWPQFKGANLEAINDGKIVLLPWRSPSSRFRPHDISTMAQEDFLRKLGSLIPTRNVYITIDKDVLPPGHAITNWDQGRLPLGYLLDMLRFVLEHHHAIGIDVTGDYSPPHYGGSTRDVMLKKLEAFIDQPFSVAEAGNAAHVNQTSNMALLQCFREAA